MSKTLAQAIETIKNSNSMLEPVIEAFDKSIAKYGSNPKSAFWRNAEWQRKRYEILSALFSEEDRQGGITINDFGCGYGAFFNYLKEFPVMEDSQYIGIDISSAMIEQAKTNITDTRARFQRDLIATEIADYTFVCGTYNMNMEADETEWTNFIKASLAQLWSKTTKGLAFNLLRSDTTEKFNSLYYADLEEFLYFCRNTLSPKIEYANDSPLPDWTIFIRR
jgi:SAM-dependent methyltransferase